MPFYGDEINHVEFTLPIVSEIQEASFTERLFELLGETISNTYHSAIIYNTGSQSAVELGSLLRRLGHLEKVYYFNESIDMNFLNQLRATCSDVEFELIEGAPCWPIPAHLWDQ